MGKKEIVNFDETAGAKRLLLPPVMGGVSGAAPSIGLVSSKYGYPDGSKAQAEAIAQEKARTEARMKARYDHPAMQRTSNPKDGMFLNMEDAPTLPEAKATAYTSSTPSSDENEALVPEDGSTVVGGGNSVGGGAVSGPVPDAITKLQEVLGKPFRYNSKSSPLYGILREQYEREAERASGRAYARATANAGGYGSSYATLAGEEAARQVMEGFDDNQMALYEAARAEYEANRQSAVEDYQLCKQLEADKAAELARSAAGGLTDTQYEAYTAAAQVWNGENKESVQAQLSRMPGMTAADVEAVMNALEADDGAVLADNVNSFKNAPTLSGAASLLATAKGRDNEAEITAEVQGSMKDAFTAALEDPTSAEVFSLLGMTEEQAAERFGGITDPDELAAAMKAEALNAAGQARVNGLLSGEDYMELMRGEVGAEIASINDKDNENENPAGALGDLVIGLQNYRDAGYVSEEEYNQLLDEVIAQSDLCGIVGRTIDYQVLEDEFWANTADEEGKLGAVMQLIGAVGTIVSTGGTIGSAFLTVAFPPAGIPLLAIGILGFLGSAGIKGIGDMMVGDSLLKMATGAIANTVGHNIDIELFEWLAGSSKSQETSQRGLAMLGCVASIPGAGFHVLDGLTGGEERTDALRELGLRAYHTQPEEDQVKLINWCNDWFGEK